jgi:DNA-binding response OmpR family regulator
LLTAIVVDQSSLIALEIRLELEAAGIQVLEMVSDGATAVERALALRPTLMTVDLVLPRLSGLQVVGALRRHGLASKVVVVSAVSAQTSILAAKDAGVSHYMLKPVSRTRLRELGMALVGPSRPLAQVAR